MLVTRDLDSLLSCWPPALSPADTRIVRLYNIDDMLFACAHSSISQKQSTFDSDHSQLPDHNTGVRYSTSCLTESLTTAYP